jgi:hypothetical protein
MINAHGPQPSEPDENTQCEGPMRELTEINKVESCESKEQWEKRQKINILKNWEIRIKFHDIGCVVYVGCKSFSFERVSSAMQVVYQYTEDPAAVAKAYGFERDL